MENNSTFLRINLKEVTHGIVNAVVAAIIVGLYGVISTPDFDIFNAPWAEIGRSVLNWGFAAFIGSLGKRFLTTGDNKLLGKIQM